jgi:lipopolysaccharide exporter
VVRALPPSPASSSRATGSDSGTVLSGRRLAAGAGAKLGTEALARAASFGAVLLAARQLGPVEFGTYLYGLGIGYVLAQGADFGLQLLVAREVAARGRAAAPLVRTALKLKVGLSTVIVLLLVPLTTGHAAPVRAALVAFGAAMVLHTFIEFAAYVFRGHQELEREVKLLTWTRLLAAGASALVLWLDGRLLSFSLVALGAVVFGCAVALAMLRREGWLRTPGPERQGGTEPAAFGLGDLVRGALPLGVAIVLSVIYLRVGWVLLFHLSGEEAVARLGAAQRLMEAAQLVPAAALAAVFPAYARALATDGGGARRLGRSSAGVLALLGTLAAGIIWWSADWAMPTLFGPEFGPAAAVLRVLALAVPLMFLNYLLTHIIVARGSQVLVAWFGGAALVSHLAASWYLIPLWGATGVAASMVLAESVLLLCCLGALRGRVRVEAARDEPAGAVPGDPAGAARGPLRVGRRAGVALLALLAALLPFEVVVGEAWGLLTLTTVEILAAGTLAAALIHLRSSGARALRVVPTRWAVLLAAFLAWLLVSAALAPELGGNALRASARTAVGLSLAASAVILVRTVRELHLVVGGALGGGLVAAGIGLREVVRGEALHWLAFFRVQDTTVGAFRRLAGPFDHANQASMYIEATAPLLVGMVALAWTAGRRRLAAAGLVAVAFYFQAGILTYSRAGIVTLAVTSLAVAFLAWRGRGGRAAAPWAVMGAMVVFQFVGTASVDPATRLRLLHGGPEQWYRVALRAPPELTLAPGGAEEVPIEIVHRGAFVWDTSGEREVRLGALWILPSGEVNGVLGRWSLPHRVEPGDTVRMTVLLRAPPEAGEHRVEWDLVHEEVTWFAPTTGHRFRSRLAVTPDAHDSGPGRLRLEVGDVASAEPAPFLPGRATLWRIAAAELAARPWTGVGLDNFRHRYGGHFGWDAWDRSIHANSWYVETVVSAGLVGGALFLGWLGLLAADLLRTLRIRAWDPLTVGIGAGLLAFLVHGLLDYFLLFHATGLLFWLLTGLWIVRTKGSGATAPERVPSAPGRRP